MKRLSMLVVAATCLSVAVPAMVTPASAVVVRKTIIKRGHAPRAGFVVRRGFGARHVCRTVVTVSRGRKVIKKVCR